MTVHYIATVFLGLLVINNLLLQECVAHRWKRIVGGKDAETNEFPYQVSLRFYDVHICGGALISNRHVLSAAHCVCGLLDEPYDELTIVTGSNNLRQGGETHAVRDVHCHPDYVYGEENSWVNDVVVIELADNITISQSQLPIRLATSNIPAGANATLSGWGRFTLHSFLAKNLQKISVTVLDNSECQKSYKDTILSSQLCTFKRSGVGACKVSVMNGSREQRFITRIMPGDSGSPLVYNNEVIGIFSWTIPCANGTPDVYSRVYTFSKFIQSVINIGHNTTVPDYNNNKLTAGAIAG